jgi:hypothetical protein
MHRNVGRKLFNPTYGPNQQGWLGRSSANVVRCHSFPPPKKPQRVGFALAPNSALQRLLGETA